MLVYVKYCPSRAAQSDFDCTTLKDWLALAHIQRIKRIWIGRDSEQRSLDAVEINGSTCFDSLVTFQRRIMHTTEEADERHDKGFIQTGANVARALGWQKMDRAPGPMETSRPGVFAAGDVRSGSVKRCAAAVGEGGMAVANVHRALASYRTR
jgi:hypothetical protein